MDWTVETHKRQEPTLEFHVSGIKRWDLLFVSIVVVVVVVCGSDRLGIHAINCFSFVLITDCWSKVVFMMRFVDVVKYPSLLFVPSHGGWSRELNSFSTILATYSVLVCEIVEPSK